MNLEGTPTPPDARRVDLIDQVLAASEQRKARLEELLKEVADAKALAEVERSNLKAQLDRSCTTVLQLTLKNAGERSANRRLCGQQVQLVKALRALVDVCRQRFGPSRAVQQVELFNKTVDEAEELLALVEVPFG